MVQDPTGVNTHALYDEAGRKVADIDADGSLVETVYNGAGQVVRTIRHATAVNTASLVDANGNPANVSLATVRPTGVQYSSWKLYDGAGRLAKTIDEQGYVTENRYDGASRVIEVVRYASPVNPANITSSTVPGDAAAQPAVDAAADRHTRYFHDRDGKLLGTLDGEGYLSENTYDGAGRLRKTKAYAKPTNASLRADGTLAQLIPVADDEHDVTSWSFHDAQGRLVARVDGEGYLSEYAYTRDATGNQVQEKRYTKLARIAPASITLATTVDDLRPVDPATYRSSITAFDQNNRVTSRTDAEGTVTAYTYDSVGNLLSTTRASGTIEARTSTASYDLLGRLVGELGGEGTAALTALGTLPTQAQIDDVWARYGVRHAYDAAGRRTSTTDASGNKTLFFYDTDGRLTHTVNALGEVQENQYNKLNQLEATVRYGTRIALTGLSGGLVNTDLTTAINGVKNATRDSRVGYTYTARGQLEQTTDAKGDVTSVKSYNAFGETERIDQKIDANQTVVNRQGYDRRGLLTSSTADEGGIKAVTAREYDAFGRLAKTTDALNNVTRTEYDRLGRVVQTINDPLNISRSSTYDAFDRVLTQTDGNRYTTSYSYDDATRELTVTHPLDVIVKTVHDRHGQTVSVSDGNKVLTTFEYNKDGKLKSTVQASGSLNITTENKYDSAGRLIEAYDANKVKTVYEYDAVNRVFKRHVDADGLNLTTEYTFDGTSVTETDPNGVVRKTEYDLNGRVWKQIVDPNGLNLQTVYSYDRQGRVLTVTDPSLTVTKYTYDKLGRRTLEQVDPTGLNLTTQYAYDKLGNLLRKIDANGKHWRYLYDAAGRMTHELDPEYGLTVYGHDGEGHVVRRTRYAEKQTGIQTIELGNGLISNSFASITSNAARDQVSRYVYDQLGRLSYSVDAAGGVVHTEYDGMGRVLTRTEYATPIGDAADPTQVATSADDRVTRSVYDDAGRLRYHVNAQGGVSEMRYDPAGNVVWRTEYAGRIDLASLSRPATAVDITSRLVTTQAANDRTTRYFHDAAGRERFELDALGYVSETRHLRDRTLTVRYEKSPVVAANATTADVAAAVLAVADASKDVSTESRRDTAGRVFETVDGAGAVTRRELDKMGRVKRMLQAYGQSEQSVTAYDYDAAGRVRARTVGHGTPAAAKTGYQYDMLGHLTAETDARGNALAYDNTAWAQAERVRLGYSSDATVLTASQRQALLDRHTTRHTYDGAGRRKTTTDALGAVTTTTYDAFGNAVKVVDPRGNAGYFYFDKLNRLSLQVDQEGYATETMYANTFADKVKSVRRYFNKVPAGTTESARPTLGTNAKDALTSFEYDHLGRMTRSTDAANAREQIEYEVAGNRFDRRVTNKVDGATTRHYDRLGRVVTETLPVTSLNAANVQVAVVNTYDYDAFGNRTQSIEAQGLPEQRITTFRYDKGGRVTHRIGQAYTAIDGATQASSTVTPVDVTRYDLLGQVIETVVGAAWNGNSASGGARTLSYYDAAGHRTMRVGTDGAVTAYTCTPTGKLWRECAYATRISSLPASAGGTPPTVSADPVNDRITTSLYDAVDRLVETRRDNVIYWEQSDASGNITLDLPGNQPATVTLKKLVYDAAGRVVQETDGRGNSVFSYYDRIGRKTLRIDQEGYATAWDYEDVFTSATQETRYAKRVAQYARQDDNGAAASLRDPGLLRSGLGNGQERVTQFTFDRVGRTTQQAVLSVAYDYVDGSGTITSRVSNAVTVYRYDGLGNVTRKEERVAELADDATNIWNVTDIRYDKLGRETRRQSPGYADYLGASVRPTMDIEYDGLGNVRRSIRRGTDDTTESDDRITQYRYNVNGERTQVIDAAKNVTVFDLDAMGRISRTVNKAVKRADGSTRDIVGLYRYDAAGRVSQTTDVETGEVRRTDYNAFGEISAKGLGSGWQEFTQYNTLGLVQKSNAGDGSTKIYLYDRNGNTTRRIGTGPSDMYVYDAQGNATRILAGTKDLTNLSVFDAAKDQTLLHSFSVYDKRNQLIRTVQPDIGYSRDKASLQQTFMEQLADLYAGVNPLAGQGGTYTVGTVDNRQTYTSVSGTSASPQAGTPASPAITAGWPTGWSTTVTDVEVHPSAARLSLSVPAGYPAGYKYAFVQQGTTPTFYPPGGVSPGETCSVPAVTLDLCVNVNDSWVTLGKAVCRNVGSARVTYSGSVVVRAVLDFNVTFNPTNGDETLAAILPRSGAYNPSPALWTATAPRSALAPSVANVTLTLPTSLPAGTYAFVNPNSPTLVYPAAGLSPGQSCSLPPSNYLLCKNIGGNWVRLGNVTTPGPTSVQQVSATNVTGVFTFTFFPDKRLFLPPAAGVTKVVAFLNRGSKTQEAVPAQALTSATGTAVAGHFALDLSGLASRGTGPYTIEVFGLDDLGNRRTAETLTVSLPTVGAPAITGSSASALSSSTWMDAPGTSRILRFDSRAIGGTSGTIHIRPSGSSGTWPTNQAFTDSKFDLSTLTLAASTTYEFLVEVGATVTRGTFTVDANGLPALKNSGLQESVVWLPRILTLDFTGKVASPGTSSYQVDVAINGTTVVKTLSGSSATIGLESDFTNLGLSRYQDKSFDYRYCLYEVTANGRKLVGQDRGTLTVGTGATFARAAGTPLYLPQGVLNLSSISGGSTTGVAGAITLSAAGSPAQSIAAGDSRRWTQQNPNDPSGTQLVLDLSQWYVPGTVKDVSFSYSGGDAVFTGTFRIEGTGNVSTSGVTYRKRDPIIPLTVSGAVRLSVLRVENNGTLESVALGPWASGGPTFNWDARNYVGGSRRFYYEAVDATGKTVGMGSGRFTLGSDGALEVIQDSAMTVRSLLRFTPPNGTTSFKLMLRSSASLPWTEYKVGALEGSPWAVDLSQLRSGDKTNTFECIYVATNNDGTTASSGTGTVTISPDGATSATLKEDHKPTVVKLPAMPPGKDVPQVQLDFRLKGTTGPYTTVVRNTGVWDGSQKVFPWTASDTKLVGTQTPVVSETQAQDYEYVLRMQNADGTAFRNEVGDPIEIAGVMTLGGGQSQGVQMKYYVTQLTQAAQIKHQQNYNAFGEISEEYDDSTLQRAQAMVQLYGGTVDAAAVKTTFTYNALGKLITKTDPQTHVTLANGFQYRARPVTHYGYDLLGRLSTITDANGNQSKQTFAGGSERVAAQWAGDGGRRKTDYDVYGDARRLTDEIGRVTEHDTDALGNLTKVRRLGITRVQNFTGADAVASTLTDSYDYDALGQRIKHTNTLGWVDSSDYDSLGRVVKTVTAQGRTTRYAYTFIDAGTVNGILGTGGANTGGWQLTTTSPDGRTTIDRKDYFGHLTWHQDQGGRKYTYAYDIGGRLASQISTGGQNIQYAYYANGFLREAKDVAMKTLSRYGYDSAGNRVWEAYSGLGTDGASPDETKIHQNADITYDELGRIAHVKDEGRLDVQYEYDAVGNRRAVRAVYWDPSNLGLRQQDEFWYVYDAANRFKLTKGSLAYGRGTSAADTNGKILIGLQGTSIEYDFAGQRLSATSYLEADKREHVETYSYSTDGYLEDTKLDGVLLNRRRADSLGRTLEYGDYRNGTLTKARTTQYDKDGRVKREDSTDGSSTVYKYYGDFTSWDPNQLGMSETGNGALAQTVYTKSDGSTATTRYIYDYWETAQQRDISITSTGQYDLPGHTSLEYDRNGYLSSAKDDAAKRTLNYVTSAAGLVLMRTEDREAEPAEHFEHHWYYAGERKVGDVATDSRDNYRTSYAESLAKSDPKLYTKVRPASSADFDQNYEPISPSYPPATGSAYTVRTGDTLRSIAQALWGDSSMWYLIAEANGLSGSESLSAGQMVLIPNKVTNIHNNAGTMRAYQPGEVIGRIGPSLGLNADAVNRYIEAAMQSAMGQAARQAQEMQADSQRAQAAQAQQAINAYNLLGPVSTATKNTAQQDFRQSEIREQNAMHDWEGIAQSDAIQARRMGEATAASALSPVFGGTFSEDSPMRPEPGNAWSNSLDSASTSGSSGYDYSNGPAWGEMTTSAVQQSEGDEPPLPRTADGGFVMPDGRILHASVTVGKLKVVGPGYENLQGQWVPDGAMGVVPVGDIVPSHYALTDLPQEYQSAHGPVRAAWDHVGQGYLAVPRADGGVDIKSPPDGYQVPSRASFDAIAIGQGLSETISAAPGALADLAKASWDGWKMLGSYATGGGGQINASSSLVRGIQSGQVTLSSIGEGFVQSSPVGFLLNAAHGNYYQAGASLGGTGVGLAAGPLLSRGIAALNELPVLGSDVGRFANSRLRTTGVDNAVVAATGVDRARVLANIADSQAARASSNFGQFVKTEGQVQANLGIWPPNSGGYAPTYGMTLDVGTQLDRFGYPGGTFVSPLGAAFESRALPPSYLDTKPYFQYEVVQPIPNVTQAKALPWFGQPGMGTQFQLPRPVQYYLENGYLKVIHQ
jgi:YD repeat-containing protein